MVGVLRKNWISPPLSPAPVFSQPSKIGGQNKQPVWWTVTVGGQ